MFFNVLAVHPFHPRYPQLSLLQGLTARFDCAWRLFRLPFFSVKRCNTSLFIQVTSSALGCSTDLYSFIHPSLLLKFSSCLFCQRIASLCQDRIECRRRTCSFLNTAGDRSTVIIFTALLLHVEILTSRVQMIPI